MASYHLCCYANDSHDSLITSLLLWEDTVTKETSWKWKSLGLRVAEEESIVVGRLGGIWRPEQECKRSHLELQTRREEFVNSQTLTQWHVSFNMAVLPHSLSKQPQPPEIKKTWSHGGGGYFSLRGTLSSLCLHGLLATS